MNRFLLSFGNYLFYRCYILYLPLYSAYKAVSDRAERKVLRELVKPGMVVVDVGANIGIYTRYLANRTGARGAVHAFEPSRVNFKRLQDNVCSATTVTIVEAAVGDHSGTAELFLSNKTNVDHRLFDSGEERRRVEVPLVCLDDYFPTGSKVDFIKIDVQGHEYSVLLGAHRLLRENPKIVCFFEFWPYGLAKAGVRPKLIWDFVTELGFNFKVVGRRAEFLTRVQDGSSSHEDDYCNIFIGRTI